MSESACPEDILMLKTAEYRRLQQRRDLHGQRAAWHYYLKDSGEGISLLAREIDCIQQRSDEVLPSQPEKANTTLVILVGETLEPLLQSICVHMPTRLVPIVNTYYGDIQDEDSSARQWRTLYRLIRQLPSHVTENIANLEQIRQVTPVSDDPTAVFTYLRQELGPDLRDPQKRVVVDVTGAKKTMVAGAFTLAAYTKAVIYYIDPEQQDENEQPYGFSARFRRIESPLDRLALNVWQQIEERYRRYDFAGALQLLQDALPEEALPGESGSSPNNSLLQSVQAFEAFLIICRDWEAGRLQEAYKQIVTLPPELVTPAEKVPTVVTELWRYWPEPEDAVARELSTAFFEDAKAIILYAEDELRRAKRLMNNGRYRDAFTRAYALHETLLKARLTVLYRVKQLRVEKLTDKQNKVYTPVDLDQPTNRPLKDQILVLLVKLQAGDMCRLLGKPKKSIPYVRLSRKDRIWWDYQGNPQYLPNEINLYSPQNEVIRNTRNLVIHSYFPVDADTVNEAIEKAEASLEEYCRVWVKDLERHAVIKYARFERPEWDELRHICQLTFIPEQNQPLPAQGG